MTMLIAAAAVFVLMHLLIAGSPLRKTIVGTIGEGPYMGLFSLASLAVIVWLSMAYGAARGTGAVFWATPDWARHAQMLVQLLAMLLIVPGLTTPNPTSVKQEGALDKANAVQGMLRITRHPFLWGVTLWAAGHLLVNGDAPGLTLFGSLALLALSGTVSIDAKRKATLGDRWDAFAAQTSNVPFAAIFAGRQRLSLAEIGWWRPVLAVAIYAAVIALHPLVIGVRAM